jgi:hypothetical protein
VANTISPKKFVPANTAYITASSGVRYRTNVVNGGNTFDVVTYPFASIKNPTQATTVTFDLTKFDTNFAAFFYFEYAPVSNWALTFAGNPVTGVSVTFNFEGGSQPALSSTYNLFQCWTDDGIVVNVRKMIGY